MSIALHKGFALLAITFAASAACSAQARTTPPPAAPTECPQPLASGLPAQGHQGGLLRGRLPAGMRRALVDAAGTPRPVRVSAGGDFVVGAGRDEIGPLRLRLSTPQTGECDIRVRVEPRTWRVERVEGVPQSTVTPPPAIAARIAREQAQVARARERDDDRADFLGGFDWPVTGRISGVFGSQRVYNGTPKSPHSGLDVAAPTGTPLRAPAPGVVSFVAPDLYLTGGTVLLDHGHGLSSSFLHLSRIDVTLGQRVERGQVLGAIGATGRATGPHMHWGLNWFGVRVDPQPLLEPLTPPAASPADATPSR